MPLRRPATLRPPPGPPPPPPPPPLQATHGCGDLIFSSHTTFVLTGVLTFTEYGSTLAIKVRRPPARPPPRGRCRDPVMLWVVVVERCAVGFEVGAVEVAGVRSKPLVPAAPCQPACTRRLPFPPASPTPPPHASLPPPPPPQVIAWIGVSVMGLCIIASRKHYSVDVVVAFYTVPLVFYTMHRRWTTKRPIQEYWCGRLLQLLPAAELHVRLIRRRSTAHRCCSAVVCRLLLQAAPAAGGGGGRHGAGSG